MKTELLRIAHLAGKALLTLQQEVLVNHVKNGPKHDKGAGDFATEADMESERIVLAELRRIYPDIPIVAEESFTEKKLPSTYFTVDPLDGTIIYSRGCREWGATICYVENGSPKCGVIVYPALDLELTAVRGEGCFMNGERLRVREQNPKEKFILAVDTFYNTKPHEIEEFLLPLVEQQRILVSRSIGAAVGNTLALLRGEVDVYYCARAKVWDVACCVLAVEEAGGAVRSIFEESFDWTTLAKGQVFAIHSELAKEVGGLARGSFLRHGQ